nr:hypothetical protein CFP56_63744 [Quercus suber]
MGDGCLREAELRSPRSISAVKSPSALRGESTNTVPTSMEIQPVVKHILSNPHLSSFGFSQGATTSPSLLGSVRHLPPPYPRLLLHRISSRALPECSDQHIYARGGKIGRVPQLDQVIAEFLGDLSQVKVLEDLLRIRPCRGGHRRGVDSREVLVDEESDEDETESSVSGSSFVSSWFQWDADFPYALFGCAFSSCLFWRQPWCFLTEQHLRSRIGE